jgi:hypothetical protein
MRSDFLLLQEIENVKSFSCLEAEFDHVTAGGKGDKGADEAKPCICHFFYWLFLFFRTAFFHEAPYFLSAGSVSAGLEERALAGGVGTVQDDERRQRGERCVCCERAFAGYDELNWNVFLFVWYKFGMRMWMKMICCCCCCCCCLFDWIVYFVLESILCKLFEIMFSFPFVFSTCEMQGGGKGDQDRANQIANVKKLLRNQIEKLSKEKQDLCAVVVGGDFNYETPNSLFEVTLQKKMFWLFCVLIWTVCLRCCLFEMLLQRNDSSFVFWCEQFVWDDVTKENVWLCFDCNNIIQ